MLWKSKAGGHILLIFMRWRQIEFFCEKISGRCRQTSDRFVFFWTRAGVAVWVFFFFEFEGLLLWVKSILQNFGSNSCKLVDRLAQTSYSPWISCHFLQKYMIDPQLFVLVEVFPWGSKYANSSKSDKSSNGHYFSVSAPNQLLIGFSLDICWNQLSLSCLWPCNELSSLCLTCTCADCSQPLLIMKGYLKGFQCKDLKMVIWCIL